MWNSNYINRQALRFFLLVCILSIFPTGRSVAVVENNQKSTEKSAVKRKVSRSYCGITCLYTIMKLAGKEIDYQKLVKPEYIGSPKGSFLSELKKAAEDNGLYAVSVGQLTKRELRQCPHHVILHVKPNTMDKEYNHYELFLGTENGKARLLDPPEPLKLVPFQELAPRWDGNGLIVSTKPIDLGAVLAHARKRFIIYASIALVIILIVHWAKRWLPSARKLSRRQVFGLSAAQGTAFAVAALSCGMVYHFTNDEGLLANANATAAIQQAHAGNFIPKIGEGKVHKLLSSGAVCIDARFARDYKAGHLKGAISLPVDANDVERQKVTADISKDSRIVMYCQSSACKYAEIVAIKLITNGFSNISIFRGGWAEWAAKNGKPKEATL